MKRNNYLLLLVIFNITVLFSLISFEKECLAQGSKSIKKENKPKLHWENGIAFRAKKALFIDFEKLEYGEIYKTQNTKNNTKTDYLKSAVVSYTNDGVLHVYDKNKNETHRYGYEPKTEINYYYKIENEKGYVGNMSGEWSPLKIKFLRYITENIDPNEEYNPCILIHVECKWFSGDYEMLCP